MIGRLSYEKKIRKKTGEMIIDFLILNKVWGLKQFRKDFPKKRWSEGKFSDFLISKIAVGKNKKYKFRNYGYDEELGKIFISYGSLLSSYFRVDEEIHLYSELSLLGYLVEYSSASSAGYGKPLVNNYIINLDKKRILNNLLLKCEDDSSDKQDILNELVKIEESLNYKQIEGRFPTGLDYLLDTIEKN